jgi:hypothetical protein
MNSINILKHKSMKNWKLLPLAMLLMAGIVFTGCEKEEDDLGPTISLKTGEGYTYEDFEVAEGETLKFGIEGAKSSNSDNNLTRYNMIYATGSQTLTMVDSVFNAPAFNMDYSIQFIGVGNATLTFRVTSEGGLTAEKILNVTVIEAGVAIRKVTEIELGSWDDPIGSFYNTVDDVVYTVSTAKQNQDKVDFLFFKGAVNLNTLAAPDDEDANTIATYELSDWTTKNQTRFNLSDMTAQTFDAIEDLHAFPEFDETNALTKVNNLEIGDVVMFRTEAGKHGYIKIVDIYRGDKIKIDVIVEV